MKSLAPDWIASITIDCCPIAEHITHVAFGSAALISFKAWMPSLFGIVMSSVTRSGLSSLYFATASFPSAASPAISNPPFVRISHPFAGQRIRISYMSYRL